MARTVTATLLGKQNEPYNTPYIYLLFTPAGGGTTYNYSSDQSNRRILLIDHNEEPYNEYASIILRNDDRTIPNLKGYWADIGYGYVTSVGNEYSQTARLWVKHQQEISAQGKIVVLLELEGMWAKAREMPLRIGDPPYYDPDTYTTDAVYDILEDVIEDELGWTLAALVEDDGIINSFQPQFEVNAQPFETHGGVMYRLINMTKSYLKLKKALEIEVKYPQTSDTEDLSYYSNEPPYFYEYMERRNVMIPNHVYVFANEGEDGLWKAEDMITAEASDATEIALYDDIIKIIVAGAITSQTDANNLAASVLTRGQMETLAGRMYGPHDCRVEMYDKVKIYDDR